MESHTYTRIIIPINISNKEELMQFPHLCQDKDIGEEKELWCGLESALLNHL